MCYIIKLTAGIYRYMTQEMCIRVYTKSSAIITRHADGQARH